MNVLFLSAWWPSRVHPTHGNFVEKHARLVARRHQVTVVAVQEDFELPTGTQQITETIRDNFREIIVYFGRGERNGWFSVLKARFLAYRRGIQLAAWLDGEPELIHANIILDAGVVGGLYAKQLRVPFIVSEHSSRYCDQRPLNSLRSLLAKLTARRAFRILPVSEYLRQSMQRNHGIVAEYHIVGNVVDTLLFTPKLGISTVPAPLRLLHVSNFDEQTKNISGILRAFRSIVATFPEAFLLHFAGDGDLSTLTTSIRSVGLSPDAVTVSGPHAEEEISALMQDHHALISFSRVETQGVVVLEALCSGLPCIAAKQGGPANLIVDGENGYLVNSENESELIEAMRKLRCNYPHFDPLAIRNHALPYCSEEAIMNNLEDLYQTACHKI